jgi:predicted nuclease with TOPRIM domain
MIHSIDQLIGKSPPALSAKNQEYQKRKEEIEAEFEKQYGFISDLEKEMQKLRQPFDDWDKEVVPKETKEAYKAMKQEVALLDLRTYDEIIDEIDEAIVFADWFSGSLEAKEFDDYDKKINGLRIEISKGLVVDSAPCHVGNYYARPLKNYIED